MRRILKTPRILKIEKIDGFTLYCMFNNGETRLIDFKMIFQEWKLRPEDKEYILLQKDEFNRVELKNNTLSWGNIDVSLKNEKGEENVFPYEIDPRYLFEKSQTISDDKSQGFGTMIRKARKKAGLTQAQLASRSGTSRFYISRLENNRTDVELSTFKKIVEAGLGKKLKMVIE